MWSSSQPCSQLPKVQLASEKHALHMHVIEVVAQRSGENASQSSAVKLVEPTA